jgi:hypothetical protein
MPDPTNVVKPGESPTPPVTNTPPNSGSPASPASGTAPAPAGTVAPAAPAAGVKPPESTVPIAALHEERAKRQNADAKIAQLQALFGDKFKLDEQGNIIPLQTAPATGTPASNDDFRKQLDKTWEEDPRKAVGMEMMMALNWYDNINNSVSFQKGIVTAKYPDFKQLESEVDAQIKKLPLGDRSQPGAVELAYLVVKGQKSDSITQTATQKAVEDLLRRIQAGEQIQGLNAGTFSAPPSAGGTGVKPTQDQTNAAAAMGMSIEDYMKYVK